MSTKIIIAFVVVICLMNFGMEVAGKKKLRKRVDALEKRVEELAGCDACSIGEQLSELQKEFEALKENLTEPVQPTQSNALECQNYAILSNGDRKNTFLTTGPTISCDNGLSANWYRFQGAAGNKMADVCPDPYRCGTHATGWLEGGHPEVSDGQVTRKACFSWSGCCTWSIDIKVRNCGDFFVYYIDGTPREHTCHLTYCGSD